MSVVVVVVLVVVVVEEDSFCPIQAYHHQLSQKKLGAFRNNSIWCILVEPPLVSIPDHHIFSPPPPPPEQCVLPTPHTHTHIHRAQNISELFGCTIISNLIRF